MTWFPKPFCSCITENSSRTTRVWSHYCTQQSVCNQLCMTSTALHLLNSVYSTARQRCVRKQHPKQLCLCPWPNTALAPAPRSSSLCADTGQLPAFARGSPSSRYGWKPCRGGKWGRCRKVGEDRGRYAPCVSSRAASPLQTSLGNILNYSLLSRKYTDSPYLLCPLYDTLYLGGSPCFKLN